MNKYDPDYMKLKFAYNKNKHILFYGCQNYIIIKIREFFFYSAYVMIIMMHNAAIKKEYTSMFVFHAILYI